MADEDLIGAFIDKRRRPSGWAVAWFLASCGFTAGALLLLVLSWR